MTRTPLAAFALILAVASPVLAAGGDPRRGAEQYRLCAACHALEPGVHTTGPSLAGMFDRPAGTAEGFPRYSAALRGAGFAWDADTLDAWLAEPADMLPGTYMDIPGMPDAQARADLIAFLQLATAPGGVERVVADGLISAAWVRGVAPQPVGDAPPEARVTAMRHCGDSFFIATADGAETAFWEKNVRIKIDSTETGPPEGVPVLIESGRMGDRTYVIFRSVAELRSFIAEKC
jgi:cytochrome c